MLGKLMKYDFKSTCRDFAGINLVIALGIIILPLLINYVNSGLLSLFAGFIITGIVIAVIVISIMNLFKIFNRNVYSREGYLTMTLPVSGIQLVISKILICTMWLIVTGIVAVLSLIIMMSITMMINGMNPFSEFDLQSLLHIPAGGWLMAVLMFILIIVSTMKEIAKLFLACSIAHLQQLKKFRIPIGILSYFVMSWFETFVLSMLGRMLNHTPIFDAINNWAISITNNGNDLSAVFAITNSAIAAGSIYMLLFAALFAAGAIAIINRKLELQ